ncbi:MAG: hypothetical protein CW338_07775 [Clostridiales bacterium]|nr:hypothetical protein [Clostridiales bacterium]
MKVERMRRKFIIKGMTCAACVAHVEKAAKRVPGIEDVRVNLMDGTLTAEGGFDADALCREVKKAGYEAFLPGDAGKSAASAAGASADEKQMRLRLLLSICFQIPLMYFSMGEMLGLPLPAFLRGTQNAPVHALLLFLLVMPIVFLNRSYYARGFKALFHLNPNMDSLVALGSAAALIYGIAALFLMTAALGRGDPATVERFHSQLYFEGAGTILTLVTVGKTLESRAKGKTGEAVEKLRRLAPDTVMLVENEDEPDREREVPLSQIVPGQIIAVRSGQRIPVDGIIIKGQCSVDESALTGESMPIDRQAGDTVLAASVVCDSRVLIRAGKVGEDTALSGIIRMVTDAASTKPPIARLADKIAGVFVPAVIGIAMITLAVWLLAGKETGFALEKAICVLVISCPCALGLATPVAVTVGIGRGADRGILYRSAEAIETAGRARIVVMDKTGTLTAGSPRVDEILTAGETEENILRTALSLENASSHPLARAVCERAGDLSPLPVTGLKELPGRGIRGEISGKLCFSGNEKLMNEEGIVFPEALLARIRPQQSAVFIARDGEPLGVITAADALRPDSRDAVLSLQKEGKQCVMLTGDRRPAAEAIAREAGVDRWICEVLPDEKEKHIRELQKDGRVMMIGDGINDAPALVTADVGVAIGAGSDIAIDSADIVLMRSSLKDAAFAAALSRQVLRNIRENLFWAFFYNIICIPLAAGVLEGIGVSLNPMIASLAMSCSSVCVCLNALRLRFFGKEKKNERNRALPETVKAPQPQTSSAAGSPAREKAPDTRKICLKIEGMMCEHCVTTVRNILEGMGAADVQISLEAGEARFDAPASMDEQQVKQAVAGEDYVPGEWREITEEDV